MGACNKRSQTICLGVWPAPEGGRSGPTRRDTGSMGVSPFRRQWWAGRDVGSKRALPLRRRRHGDVEPGHGGLERGRCHLRRSRPGFMVSREHVSCIRSKAATQGSAGLLDGRDRPRVLGEVELRAVYAWADESEADTDIAVKMGVSAATISRCLTRR